MPTIRIVKSWTSPDLLRQTPGGAGRWGDCRFTLDPVAEADYVVVLNHATAPVEVRVPPANVWALIQEPPIPQYRWLEHGFPHYRRIFAQNPALRDPRIVRSHGALPWHVGRDLDTLVSTPVPEKHRVLSWITSNRREKPGHRRRMRFLERLQRSVPFDLFGRGFTPLADKWDGLAPYRYALAIENHAVPHYWTEKVADCFLAWTMPLYFGAENLSAYFPAESFVWIDLADRAAPRRIAEVIRSNLWLRRRDAIAEARRRVLQEHQFFPFISRLVAQDPPTSAPQLCRIPAVRSLSDYYVRTTPLQRTWHRLRRLPHRLGLN